MEIARQIISNFEFSTTGNPYPPGYPLFISPSQLFLPDFNLAYHVVLIINSFLSTLIVFPAYFIARKFFDRKLSVILAFFILVLPMTFLFSFTVMSENLFIPLYMFSCWIILEAFSKKTPFWWAMSGFSLFALYFTRSIGIAAIMAFIILVLSDIIQSKERISAFISKWPAALSFCLPFLVYNLYNTIFLQKPFNLLNAGLSNYPQDNYVQIILEGMFTNFIGFSLTISRILVNEIGYYLFACFFIFIIFCFWGLYCTKAFRSDEESGAYNLLFFYSLITSAGLIFLSSIHLATYYVPFGYTLLMGRYLEPTIPVFIILGTIGYSNYTKFSPKTKKNRFILFPIFMFVFLITYAIFPLEEYRWANTISLYHFIILQKISVVAGINGLLILLFAIFIIGTALIAIKNVNLVISFGIMLSIFGSSIIYAGPMISMNHVITGKMQGTGEMAAILAATEKNSIILFDQDLTLSTQGKWLFYMVRWWANERVRFTNTTSITPGFTYLISDKQLPYKPLSVSKNLNVTLYGE